MRRLVKKRLQVTKPRERIMKSRPELSAEKDERMWRQVTLRRSIGANDIDAIAFFERVPGGDDQFADSKTRLWCRGIVVDQPWLRVDHLTIESPLVLRLDFPPAQFEGFPLHLHLERPSSLRMGSVWLLRGEDGKRIEASFAQYSDTRMSWAQVEGIEEFYKTGKRLAPGGTKGIPRHLVNGATVRVETEDEGWTEARVVGVDKRARTVVLSKGEDIYDAEWSATKPLL